MSTHSRANIHQAVTRFMDLQWTLDFSERTIAGVAMLTMEVVSNEISEIILDAKKLAVTRVEVSTTETATTGANSGDQLRFRDALFTEAVRGSSEAAVSILGEGLRIDLPTEYAKSLCAGSRCVVRVHYATSPNDCSALCWLPKELTGAGTHPFLYSQCQAIHARTLLPCQDAPCVRAPYTAIVHAPPGIAVLMSALQEKNSGDEPNVFHFRQPLAIPSYLVAIAAGSIVGADVSPRCRVYAEPTSITRAKSEFEDMENFLKVAESIAGPYEWQRYDVIVLPPSFPYGGMENPNLTFVTPSIITGDKSAVSVIAHEICHSWSGNGVGIIGWEDFFLNEGFTVFLERLMTRKMQGRAIADLEGILGAQHLRKDVQLYGEKHPLTALRPVLTGIDPDDAFSSVPYEKGFALLMHIENLVGEDSFGEWLRKYFQDFKFQAIDAARFVSHLEEFFTGVDSIRSINWDEWLSAPGMPLQSPTFSRTAMEECTSLALSFVAIDAPLQGPPDSTHAELPADVVPPKNWLGKQHETFLSECQKALADRSERKHFSPWTLRIIDNLFGYNSTMANGDVLLQWFQLCCLCDGYTSHVSHMKQFLSQFGRMKYVRPLYRCWSRQDAVSARAFFQETQPKYHPIARKMIARDLKCPEQ